MLCCAQSLGKTELADTVYPQSTRNLSILLRAFACTICVGRFFLTFLIFYQFAFDNSFVHVFRSVLCFLLVASMWLSGIVLAFGLLLCILFYQCCPLLLLFTRPARFVPTCRICFISLSLSLLSLPLFASPPAPLLIYM